MIKTLQATDNTFLADHKIGENRVLPTVCAIAWMADAAESIQSGYHYYGFENYKLFKGIVFDGSEAQQYFIDLNEKSSSNGDIQNSDALYFEVKISSINSKGKPVFHYAAELILKSNLQHNVLSDVVLGPEFSSSNAIDAKDLYRDGTLFHGESLQGIQEILKCDQKGLILACKVPSCAENKQGDFPLISHNIFANDLVYQAMLVWVRKQMGMGSLPSTTQQWFTYQQVLSEQAFYLRLTVVDQTDTKLLADIELISAEGKLMASIKSAEVTVSENLNDLFKPVASLEAVQLSGM